MGWVTGIMVYVVIWCVVLFTVLPWGVRPVENPEPGHMSGAPENPRLLLKFAVTTVIAVIIWAALDWLILSDLISFRNQ